MQENKYQELRNNDPKISSMGSMTPAISIMQAKLSGFHLKALFL
jgi:hypothetical protein